MKDWKISIVLCAALFSGIALGEKVIQVSEGNMRFLTNQEKTAPLEVGDPVCAVRDGKRLACGVVEAANEFGASIHIRSTGRDSVLVGDIAELTLASSQVLSIGAWEIEVSHPVNRHWEEGETLCILSEGECGTVGNVVYVDETLARMTVDKVTRSPRVGDNVRHWVEPQEAEFTKTRGDETETVTATILKVSPSGRLWIGEPSGGKWVLGDRVCTMEIRAEVSCGTVGKLDAGLALVLLNEKRDEMPLPNPGDVVEKRNPVETPREVASVPLNHSKEWIGLGLNSFFPMVHYQKALTPKLSAGVMPMFMRFRAGQGDLTGASVLATLGFHPHQLFDGIWLQFGGGLSLLNVVRGGASESLVSPLVMTNVGWRWQHEDYSFSAGFGANYFLKSQQISTGLSFSGFVPSILLDVSLPL